MNITIGADPEIFIQDKNGKAVSAHNLIPGTKKKPHPVPNGAVQVDGVAAEFNIDPASTEEEFVTYINSVMNTLKSMFPKEHEPLIAPTAQFELDSLPPEVTELGCEVDYNAYTGEVNPEPDASVDYRTGAGHIHIGWGEDLGLDDPEHKEACEMLAKQLDMHLALPALLFDTDYKRRKLYGKIGAFRPKTYGMEYRVLSNAWLKDERLIRWVFTSTQKAFEKLVAGNQTASHLGQTLETLFREDLDIKEAVLAYCNHYDIALPPEDCWEL